MTDKRDDLVNLRDRIAAATGPDREIDDALWSLTTGLSAYTEGEPLKAGNPPRRTRLSIPNYTASIDAAVTLVPYRYGWGVENYGVHARAWLLFPKPTYEVKAHTKPLALCFARIEYELAKLEPTHDR